MLYERWLAVANERRTETALRDLASGRCWTFQQLREAAESKSAPDQPVLFPGDDSSNFIVEVLQGWRAEKVICPLERGQSAPQVAVPPAGCVHLKSTSATTSGAARLAAFTPAQLLADAGQIVATMGLRPDWPNLGVISMAHSYGFSNLVLPLLLHGIPLSLPGSPLPEIMLRGAARESAFTLPAVPALWRAWHAARTIPANLRLAICAGAPLPINIERAVFKDHGVKIHNFYGSTECGGIAYDASPTPRTDETYAGKPLREVGVSVDARDCLTVSSQAVGETYWPEPAESLGAGRFQTDDLAAVKPEGLYLLGRLSDQINVAGRKVSPATIEQTLMRNPDISACLVFGIPEKGAGRGDSIVACVVARNPTNRRELKEFLLPRLPSWQIPREWWFVDSLEPNHRGKLSRAEWRKRFLDEFAGTNSP